MNRLFNPPVAATTNNNLASPATDASGSTRHSVLTTVPEPSPLATARTKANAAKIAKAASTVRRDSTSIVSNLWRKGAYSYEPSEALHNKHHYHNSQQQQPLVSQKTSGQSYTPIATTPMTSIVQSSIGPIEDKGSHSNLPMLYHTNSLYKSSDSSSFVTFGPKDATVLEGLTNKNQPPSMATAPSCGKLMTNQTLNNLRMNTNNQPPRTPGIVADHYRRFSNRNAQPSIKRLNDRLSSDSPKPVNSSFDVLEGGDKTCSMIDQHDSSGNVNQGYTSTTSSYFPRGITRYDSPAAVNEDYSCLSQDTDYRKYGYSISNMESVLGSCMSSSRNLFENMRINSQDIAHVAAASKTLLKEKYESTLVESKRNALDEARRNVESSRRMYNTSSRVGRAKSHNATTVLRSAPTEPLQSISSLLISRDYIRRDSLSTEPVVSPATTNCAMRYLNGIPAIDKSATALRHQRTSGLVRPPSQLISSSQSMLKPSNSSSNDAMIQPVETFDDIENSSEITWESRVKGPERDTQKWSKYTANKKGINPSTISAHMPIEMQQFVSSLSDGPSLRPWDDEMSSFTGLQDTDDEYEDQDIPKQTNTCSMGQNLGRKMNCWRVA